MAYARATGGSQEKASGFSGAATTPKAGIVLAIVPARGGSVGVPNKPLRELHGKSLILHTLDTLKRVPEISRVVVTTEDEHIASVCRLHGADVWPRSKHLSEPDVPVALPVCDVVDAEQWDGPVGVFQPTSPTLKPTTISAAIRCFYESDYASLCSVVADSHLIWDDHGPLFESRVNRQGLPPFWRETGGIQLARAVPVGPIDPLVGHPHKLFPIPADEGIDIDDLEDLERARRVMGRKTVALIAVGGGPWGLGHFRRQEAIAQELAHHDLIVVQTGDPREWEPLACDLLVLDVLDTGVKRIAQAHANGTKVVTLEDLGPGAHAADLVVNELYEPEWRDAHILSGPRFAVLRPEFLAAPKFPVREKADRVLVTFGGTDPANLMERVGRIASREAVVETVNGTMAESMLGVDLVVTSAGRSVHEAAALGVPTISIAANERESRHSHCAGIVRLGLAATLSDDQIEDSVRNVLRSRQLREEMSETSRGQIDGRGTRRIIHHIEALLEGL